MPPARWASTLRARPLWWPDARFAAALAFAAAGALAPAPASADFTGRVVAVADGDTLTVRDGARDVHVRLWGIDAPERGQSWSKRSRTALVARAMHRDVRVSERGRDSFGRTIGRVAVDGADLGDAQLADGLAWVYRRYSDDRAMIGLEDAARAARRGLWSDPAPVPPWVWRESHPRPPRPSPASGQRPRVPATG